MSYQDTRRHEYYSVKEPEKPPRAATYCLTPLDKKKGVTFCKRPNLVTVRSGDFQTLRRKEG